MKLLTFKRLHLTSPSSPKITPCFINLLHNKFSFAHTLEEHLFCRQLPFPFIGEVSFYYLPKIIVEKISIITLSMAYFDYLHLVTIRNRLNKKMKVFQTNLFIIQRKQEKLQSLLFIGLSLCNSIICP